jgi:hypothetical protein
VRIGEATVITPNGLVDVSVRDVPDLGHRAVDVLREGQLALVLCVRCGIVWLEGADELAPCEGRVK